jgi:hypothetical protein
MVSPVAQAVGNTVKRVVILIATSLAFATPMTPIGMTGSAIAMAGVLVYSLVQQAVGSLSAQSPLSLSLCVCVCMCVCVCVCASAAAPCAPNTSLFLVSSHMSLPAPPVIFCLAGRVAGWPPSEHHAHHTIKIIPELLSRIMHLESESVWCRGSNWRTARTLD